MKNERQFVKCMRVQGMRISREVRLVAREVKLVARYMSLAGFRL